MSSQGPNFPTSATGNTTTFGGGSSSITWSNPQNIGAADSVFAISAFGINLNTCDLIGTGFGFSVPATATINGIQLDVNRESAVALNTIEGFVKLIKGGSATGNNKSTFAFLTTTPTTVSYGGSTDLWGATLAPSDVNASNFGAFVTYGYGPSGDQVSVDFMRITVFYTVPAPSVTSVSANIGPATGGTNVTITGSNFLATPTSITFGGAAATNIVFNSATSVSCTTPAHAAGTVNVVVTNPDGQTGTGTNVFTFNPPPTVTSCSPAAGPPSGGNSVTITGTGFLATPTSITFGGAAATNIVFNSATSVSCTAPAHAAGTVNVVVTNPDGQSGTGTNVYTYNPPPSFSSCNPGNGPAAGGTSVTISGANFVATPGVTFGGVAASNVTFVSSTSLTCATPAHSPVTVDIVITNPDGQTATGSKVFLYLATGSRFLSF